MSADVVKLRKLCFYAIDTGAPDKLAMDPGRNTLAKIAGLALIELEMLPPGIADMWQTINAHVRPYAGGEPVPASAQNADTVHGVWKTVCAASGLNPMPTE